MDVQIPVYLYDVTTASASPRLIVTCRHSQPAHDIASRLNALRTGGELDDSPFSVQKRSATIAMTVVPGSSVSVMGYDVDVDALAVVLRDAEQARP